MSAPLSPEERLARAAACYRARVTAHRVMGAKDATAHRLALIYARKIDPDFRPEALSGV